MPDPKHYLRVATKAVIVEDGRLLCTLNTHPGDGERWYCLPGGGLHPDETLAQGLLRECREEIGAAVEIGDGQERDLLTEDRPGQLRALLTSTSITWVGPMSISAE